MILGSVPCGARTFQVLGKTNQETGMAKVEQQICGQPAVIFYYDPYESPTGRKVTMAARCREHPLRATLKEVTKAEYLAAVVMEG